MNKAQIQELYRKFHVPKHVIKHMKKVRDLSLYLAKKLEEKGINIDKSILEMAALTHDILRVCDFRSFEPEKFPQEVTKRDLQVWQNLRDKYNKIGHIKAMSQILKKMGETKLADLIEKHDFFKVDELNTWEEKVLFYADKRVDGDKIVTQKKRFEEGKKRNFRKEDNLNEILKLEEKTKHLEKEFKQKTENLESGIRIN